MTTIRRLSDIPVPESAIQVAIRDYLALDGWHVLETDRKRRHPETGSVRHPLGEPGMPDLLALRYAPPNILWVEVKGRRGHVEPHQRIWHFAERQRGACVLVLGEDCPASISGWLDWYAASGLMRRCLAAPIHQSGGEPCRTAA